MEGRNNSCLKHGNAVGGFSVRCLIMMNSIRDVKESEKRKLRETMLVGEEYNRLMERAERTE